MKKLITSLRAALKTTRLRAKVRRCRPCLWRSSSSRSKRRKSRSNKSSSWTSVATCQLIPCPSRKNWLLEQWKLFQSQLKPIPLIWSNLTLRSPSSCRRSIYNFLLALHSVPTHPYHHLLATTRRQKVKANSQLLKARENLNKRSNKLIYSQMIQVPTAKRKFKSNGS